MSLQGSLQLIRSIGTAFQVLTNPDSWRNLHLSYTRYPNSASAATRLPLTLWQRIAILLPPSTQLCLALSCRHLYDSLGPHALESVQHNHREKIEFLKLLDYSLPDHFLCAGCLTYHHRRNDKYLEHPHFFREAPLVPRLVNVKFNAVQSHLRLSRFGFRYGRKIEDNITLRKKIDSSSQYYPSGYSYRIQSAVVDGHLLLRIDSSKMFQSPNDQNLWNIVQWFAQCTHYYDEIEELCHCALAHAGTDKGGVVQCEDCLRRRRCHSCASEYIVRLTARSQPGTGYILSVIRWTDLGSGNIPWYGEWDVASKIGIRRNRRDIVYDLLGLGSVRSRFEGECGPTRPPISDEVMEPLYTKPMPDQATDSGFIPDMFCKIATFDWETRTTFRDQGAPKLLPGR